jgi:iron complex outermembrane receptor protein
MLFTNTLRSSSIKGRALTTASTLAIVTSFFAGNAAYAQNQAAAVEEIVVTGSRIAREGYEAPTPLTVMNIEAIENAAGSNIAEAMKDMPVFSGNATPTSAQGGVSNGNAGLNVLNLRGIGAGRSLILLDGHRTVGSNAVGAVDINTFPQMLIARVDIVTGGVSAVYGSDGVAGVANFILDKEYTGVKGEISGGVTSYGDDKNYKIGLAAGFPFAGGRGHVLISGEQVDKEGILNGSNGRQWDLDGVQTITNPSYVATCTPGACQPFYISSNQVGMSTTAAGGIITAGPLKGTAFGPGGVPYQFAYGSVFSAPLMIGGEWKTQMTAPFYASIDNKESRQAAFLRVAYDVTDNVNVYAQASWNRAFTFGTTLPRLRQGSASTNSAAFLNNTAQPYVTGGPASGLAPGVPFPFPLVAASNQVGVGSSNIISLGLKVDNAFIPDEIRARIPAGTTLLQIGAWTIDLPLVSTENEHFVNRNVIGATGAFDAFGKDWSWDLYFQNGYSRNSITAGGGITNEVRWAQAVDAVRHPTTGRIVCRSTLTNPTDGCVPFNVLGIGVNSEAAKNFVLTPGHMYQKLTQNVWAATVTGEPFDLWAGPVSMALNVEHRKEKVGGINENDDQFNNTFSGNYKPAKGKYSVTEGAVELIVPLAKGESWADNWDLSLAARATDYSTSGYVTTWKVGTTYTPIPDVKFRVTRSRDIRAPNLSELYLPGTFGRGNQFDPFSNTTHQVNNITTGNTNLRPEKGDTLGIGVVLQPTFVPGLSFSVDYWNIKIKDAIQGIGTANVINFCYEGVQSGNASLLAYCNSILFQNAALRDFVVTVTSSGFNVAKTLDRGIDLDVTYRMGLDELVSSWAGTLTFTGNTTIYLKSYQDDSINLPTDVAGQNNGGQANWRMTLNATYNLDPIRVGFTARGVSSGTINNSWIVCDPGTCPRSTTDHRTLSSVLGGTLGGRANHVPGRFYFDMSTSYKFAVGDSVEADAFLNIKNIANSDPVVIPIQTGTPHSSHPINSGLYDTFGRVFRAGVRFRM